MPKFNMFLHPLTGKLPDTLPLCAGHAGTVLDTDFHPFNDHVIASGAEDCKVMIWKIPDGGFTETSSTPTVTLSGHQRKVGNVLFHPTADNVLASAGADFVIKIWDIEKSQEKVELSGHGEIIQSLTYSWTGDRIATTCKDKVLRVYDVRSKAPVMETPGHQGVKGSRAAWLGDTEKIVTTGFSKTSDRQIYVWDCKNAKSPIKTIDLDTSSGILMPYFDRDTSVLFLGGKGDGNIRYYEYEDATSDLHYLTEYKSPDPQRGIAFLPKRACNISENEIARAYKVHNTLVEPISFTVPRKADSFQADIFPDTIGDVPSTSADEFFSGKALPPILISLEKGYKPSQKRDFVAEVTPQSSDPSKNVEEISDIAQLNKNLKQENEQLRNDLIQRDLRIKQLEAQLATASLK
jgi:coronin-1B/1C/6